jgi:dihydroorotase
VIDNVIDVIGTDHAPHLFSDKTGGALGAASGMPMIQFSLPIMLELSQNEVITKEQVIEKMCHAPADLYRVEKRGYIRPGYQADLVLVDPNQSFKIESDIIQSKCAWSPLEGMTMHTKVIRTLVNGHTVYQDGSIIDDKYRGMPLQFNN